MADRNRKHGGKGTPEHYTWGAMRSRCNQPTHPAFDRYGGRGIKVCRRWDSFANFLSDMGPRPDRGWSIDRINNDKNYSPSNCRWTTRKEQQRNMRTNRLVVFGGEEMPLVVAAERAGVKYAKVKTRLYSGWTVAEALEEVSRS